MDAAPIRARFKVGAASASALYARSTLILLWMTSIAGAFLMWRAFSDYVFEDAYITYRYADNIAHGMGFVFTAGERVLGTTAPLYTLILAAAGWLGLDIPAVSGFIFAASVAATGLLGGLLLRAQGAPLLGVLFSLFAASGGPEVQNFFGLETPFVTALVLGTIYAAMRGREWTASALVAAAFLTRYDAALLAILFFALLAIRDRRIPVKKGLLATAIVLPWLTFAYTYFGTVLPNTLGAKTGDTSPQAYLVSMAERQWGLLMRFVRNTGLVEVLGASTTTVLASGLCVGVAAALILRARRAPAVYLLAAYPAALFGGYALIGPSLDFQWYPIPGVFCAVLLAFVGVAALLRALRLHWAAPLAIGPLAWMSAQALPGHLDAHAYEMKVRGQYRYRVETYEAMSDWVVASGLQDERLMTIEPGYFVFRSGNPAIDEAGLVTEGVYFHGDPSRRTDRVQLLEDRKPGLVLGVAGAQPTGYMMAHAGSVKFQLQMPRDLYGARFDSILEGHRETGRRAVAEIDGPFNIDLGPEARGPWIDCGGIAAREGNTGDLHLDGTPYGEPYMYVPQGEFGAESPTFEITFDRLDFLLAAFEGRGSEAQLVVDGAVVLAEIGHNNAERREFQRISWDLAPWRGKVAALRIVSWEGATEAIAIDHIKTADDRRRTVFDDFECAHCSTHWSETFGEPARLLYGPARTHGAGLFSSKGAAHSFGQSGVLAQVSKPIKVEHDEMRFLFFDFADNRVGAQLLVNGTVVREILGVSSERVRNVRWDVSEYRGREATFRVFDHAEPTGAWVGVDQITFADR